MSEKIAAFEPGSRQLLERRSCVIGCVARHGSVTSSGALHAGGLAGLGQLRDAAGAEADGGRVVPVGAGRCGHRWSRNQI